MSRIKALMSQGTTFLFACRLVSIIYWVCGGRVMLFFFFDILSTSWYLRHGLCGVLLSSLNHSSASIRKGGPLQGNLAFFSKWCLLAKKYRGYPHFRSRKIQNTVIDMRNYAQNSFQRLVDSGNLTLRSTTIMRSTRICFAPLDCLNEEINDAVNKAMNFIHNFIVLCGDLQLPINNPIAFFHKLDKQKEMILNDESLLFKARNLLKLVYADYSFLFGSSYDYFDKSKSFRLSDFIVQVNTPVEEGYRCIDNRIKIDGNSEYENRIWQDLMEEQGRLNTSLVFFDNYRYGNTYFHNLDVLNQKYLEWKNLCSRRKCDVVFHIRPSLAQKFFELYSYFSLFGISKDKQTKTKKN